MSNSPPTPATKRGTRKAKLRDRFKCPPELGAVAQKEWDRIFAELTRDADLLQAVDQAMLAVYCAAYAEWLEATEALHKYGTVMKSPTGYPIQSPYVSIANQKAQMMLAVAKEFGFTPASRGRLPRISNDNPDFLDLQPLTL